MSHLCHFSAGQRQPDNREQVQQGGEEEACMAVLNNFYGDGECSLVASLPWSPGMLDLSHMTFRIIIASTL